MGYRSDLTIAITEEAFLKCIIDQPQGVKCLEEYADSKASLVHDGNSCVYYEINDIKWYANYEDIAHINDMFDSLADHEYGIIRVGEDAGDIESSGSPWDFEIYVTTSINSPV